MFILILAKFKTIKCAAKKISFAKHSKDLENSESVRSKLHVFVRESRYYMENHR